MADDSNHNRYLKHFQFVPTPSNVTTDEERLLIPIFVGSPRTEIGCASNGDCPTQRSCINQRCVNPCKNTNICQADQECQVDNHNPVCVKGMLYCNHRCSVSRFIFIHYRIPNKQCANARAMPTVQIRTHVTDAIA